MTTVSTAGPRDSVTVAARIDLAAAHRLAVIDGLNEGTWNHLSLALADDPSRILITPSFTHWSQVTASSLIECEPDLRREDAVDVMAWIAYRIHYPLHELRPDARCVLHAHPPYATALSMLDTELNVAEQNALTFYGRVAWSDRYDLEVGPDLGQGKYMAEQLGDAEVLFLRNHGVVVVGETVADAYTDLYTLERACRTQVLAASTGEPLRPVSNEYLAGLGGEQWRQEIRDLAAGNFRAMKRVLDQSQPDYAD